LVRVTRRVRKTHCLQQSSSIVKQKQTTQLRKANTVACFHLPNQDSLLQTPSGIEHIGD
jgi:hypothetical protein